LAHLCPALTHPYRTHMIISLLSRVHRGFFVFSAENGAGLVRSFCPANEHQLLSDSRPKRTPSGCADYRGFPVPSTYSNNGSEFAREFSRLGVLPPSAQSLAATVEATRLSKNRSVCGVVIPKSIPPLNPTLRSSSRRRAKYLAQRSVGNHLRTFPRLTVESCPQLVSYKQTYVSFLKIPLDCNVYFGELRRVR
jgi:hypothetical protein